VGRRHYNYFRDYEPGTGRYVESDPIGLGGGVNTYGYVGGRPLLAIDPSGLLDNVPWRPPVSLPTLPQSPAPTPPASPGLWLARVCAANPLACVILMCIIPNSTSECDTIDKPPECPCVEDPPPPPPVPLIGSSRGRGNDPIHFAPYYAGKLKCSEGCHPCPPVTYFWQGSGTPHNAHIPGWSDYEYFDWNPVGPPSCMCFPKRMHSNGYPIEGPPMR